MKKGLLPILLLIVAIMPCISQVSGAYVDNIKSLRLEVNGIWNSHPVMPMGGNNRVDISFDDLQHNYIRYTYHIIHCNADWQKSDLLESEYLEGFNDSPIDDYKSSMNTTMLYNHYKFSLPNENVKLLVSGNYMVEIYEDGYDEPVGCVCFSVLENKVGLTMDILSNTDIDAYKSHQQLEFSINYQSYNVNRPEEELYPVVYQNRHWDTHVEGLRPSYVRSNELIYNHNRSLIFDGGNEYRRFEILNEYVPTMHVENMSYHDPYYHATIMEDLPRFNYIYDQDQNGRYYVRNSDNYENATESDYFYTHFKLKSSKLEGGDVYLNGDLTYDRYIDEYKMEYDEAEGCYTIYLPLKQGSYNYQYVFLPDDGGNVSIIDTEGSFYQTENEYSIYVYHRPFGERYDHLVGFGTISNFLGTR